MPCAYCMMRADHRRVDLLASAWLLKESLSNTLYLAHWRKPVLGHESGPLRGPRCCFIADCWALLSRPDGSDIPAGSFILSISGQTPCCINAANGSIIGICDVSQGLQPSFSWGGSRTSPSSDALVLYLVPTGLLSIP